jgi:hypothetical protein
MLTRKLQSGKLFTRAKLTTSVRQAARKALKKNQNSTLTPKSQRISIISIITTTKAEKWVKATAVVAAADVDITTKPSASPFSIF